MSRGSDIGRLRQGTATPLGNVEGTAHVAFAAGTGVIVQRTFASEKRSELMTLRRNRPAERIDTGRAQYVSLMDVAPVEGRRRVLFTTYHPPAGERGETSGYLYLQEPMGSQRRRVTEASGPEYEITRASYGGGVIVTSAWSDLTEVFRFLQPDGNELTGRPNPTAKLPYGQPPYMSDAVLSEDGTSLAYLEGPDFDQHTQQVIGDWVLVVLDQTTGRERLRVKVVGRDMCVPWMDYDGRWIVVSRAKWTRGTDGYEVCSPSARNALPAVVIDSSAKRLELVELAGVVGVATIDD